MESDSHDDVQPSEVAETEKYLSSDYMETFEPEIPADATNGNAERLEPDPEIELPEEEPVAGHEDEPESESLKEGASEGLFLN